MKKIIVLFVFVLIAFAATGCGDVDIDSKIPAVAGEINENAILVEEIEYSEGKLLRLFENHFEFDGNQILYNDIEIIRYQYYMSSTTSGFATGGGYVAAYTFVLSDGSDYSIRCGDSKFSLGASIDLDEIKIIVDAFVRAVYNNVVRAVAHRAYEQISGGAELNIAGLIVNSSEATGKRNTLINAENYGAYKFSDGNIIILSKTGDTLFRVKMTEDNADLLPYVLNGLFLTNDSENSGIEFEVSDPIFKKYGFWIILGSIFLLAVMLMIIFGTLKYRGLETLYILGGALLTSFLITQFVWMIIASINNWPWFVIF